MGLFQKGLKIVKSGVVIENSHNLSQIEILSSSGQK
jgi:hypothetical protein